MFTLFQYPAVHWSPPKLTPAERIETGRAISQLGLDNYVKTWKPDFAAASSRGAKKPTTLQNLGAVLIIGGSLALAICVPALLAAVGAMAAFIMLSLAISSFFAKQKFKKWARECLRAYEEWRKKYPVAPKPRSKKVEYCIGVIEVEIIKCSLISQDEPHVCDLCGRLLSMALGDERIVLRLIRLEWKRTTDIVSCLERAIALWESDHNRFV